MKRNIPEFIIQQETASKLAKQVDRDEPLYLKIDLAIRHPSNNVEVDLWFSTLIDVRNELLEGMHDYH